MSHLIDQTFQKRLEATKQKKLMPLLEETLRAYAPKACRTMSQENLNKLLNTSYQNAQAQGTRNFGEVKAFTFLAYNLGTEFYKDPLYPKIVNIFKSSSPIEVKLSRAVNYYLKEHYIYTKEQSQEYLMALTKLEKVAFSEIPNPLTTKQMAKYLYAAYPQRVKSLGGVEKLQKLMPYYHEVLEAQQLQTPLGHFVFYMVWMFKGSSLLTDPQFAWFQKEFYAWEKNSNAKSNRFLEAILKRLKCEMREVEKVLEINKQYSFYQDINIILSGCKLNEESKIILTKIEEPYAGEES